MMPETESFKLCESLIIAKLPQSSMGFFAMVRVATPGIYGVTGSTAGKFINGGTQLGEKGL